MVIVDVLSDFRIAFTLYVTGIVLESKFDILKMTVYGQVHCDLDLQRSQGWGTRSSLPPPVESMRHLRADVPNKLALRGQKHSVTNLVTFSTSPCFSTYPLIGNASSHLRSYPGAAMRVLQVACRNTTFLVSAARTKPNSTTPRLRTQAEIGARSLSITCTIFSV
jgi:hypothetical protein